MITVKEIHHHTLDYECSCGVQGECMFKPPSKSSLMVLEIRCPMCKSSERLKIMKYASEKDKKKLATEDADLHWVLILDNRIKED